MNNYEKTFMENIKNIIMLFLMYVGHAISFLLYKNAEILSEIHMVIFQIIYHIIVLQCLFLLL